MISPASFALAYALDWLIGDPTWLPHPVRWMGRMIMPSAQKQVARIVGRDTLELDEREVTRAVIETLAESASDGIVAPMFYLAIGGVPASLAYKAVNTLDSMIGHRGKHYEFFGKCAARLDDVASFIPTRVTALLLVCAAWTLHLDWRGAWLKSERILIRCCDSFQRTVR